MDVSCSKYEKSLIRKRRASINRKYSISYHLGIGEYFEKQQLKL
tara:strand:- start:5812 stop:5943 length:132 start_codon:yes stop_codon:yes gene_type:complete